jgi:hypothetical protein
MRRNALRLLRPTFKSESAVKASFWAWRIYLHTGLQCEIAFSFLFLGDLKLLYIPANDAKLLSEGVQPVRPKLCATFLPTVQLCQIIAMTGLSLNQT